MPSCCKQANLRCPARFFLHRRKAGLIPLLLDNHHQLAHRVHSMPCDIDMEIARFKLQAMGIELDTLSAEQQASLSSWQEGT
jgi:S-adenosylhomocysteine hydrolase